MKGPGGGVLHSMIADRGKSIQGGEGVHKLQVYTVSLEQHCNHGNHCMVTAL